LPGCIVHAVGKRRCARQQSQGERRDRFQHFDSPCRASKDRGDPSRCQENSSPGRSCCAHVANSVECTCVIR
jgi:hypothetical protein